MPIVRWVKSPAPRVITEALAALGPHKAFVAFTICNVSHLGALGTHLLEVAEAGRIGFLSQVTQPVMSPAGATRPAIGNNPIAFAAPCPDGPPLLFDFASSRVARGKIHEALREGHNLPEGWAIGPDGAPTTDALQALAGSILPAADHKGLALAMMVEVMAGALAGARPDRSADGAPAGVGAFGFVLAPDWIGKADSFASGMRAWMAHYSSSVGENGRVPGQRAAALKSETERLGLPVAESLVAQLRALSQEAGLVFPELDRMEFAEPQFAEHAACDDRITGLDEPVEIGEALRDQKSFPTS